MRNFRIVTCFVLVCGVFYLYYQLIQVIHRVAGGP